MDHEPVLISTIAIGLTAAFIGGLAARRIGLPPIVGGGAQDWRGSVPERRLGGPVTIP